MTRPVTLRLDDKTRRRLASVARRRGRSPSALMRTAIEAWLEAEEGGWDRISPYDAISDLIGCVDGGDPKRSTRGGLQIATMLRGRRTGKR